MKDTGMMILAFLLGMIVGGLIFTRPTPTRRGLFEPVEEWHARREAANETR